MAVKGTTAPAWLAISALAVALAGCSRADLDAITPGPGDGGADTGTPVSCPSPALPAGASVQTVQIGSAMRSYVLHVPPTYPGNRPVPLIVDFHALNGSGMQQRASSPFPEVTDPEGVVMAFPTGLAGPAGTGWNVGPCCVAGVDDVAFAKSVVAHALTKACIDPARVYASGFSMGGGMAHVVACRAADVFAAVAPIAFDLMQENVGDCQPVRAITVISLRGSGDPLIPYEGGPSSVVPGMPVTFLGAEATFRKWAELDGCTGVPSGPDASGCSAYSNCAGGVEVMLCPRESVGQNARDAALAWPVLKRHALF